MIINVQPEALTVEICPKRRERLLETLRKILESRIPTPSRQAGPGGYSRKTGIHVNHNLWWHGSGCCSALLRSGTLEHETHFRTVGCDPHPHIAPDTESTQDLSLDVSETRTQSVIYSDAFFQLGERNLKHSEAPELWSPKKRKPRDNG